MGGGLVDFLEFGFQVREGEGVLFFEVGADAVGFGLRGRSCGAFCVWEWWVEVDVGWSLFWWGGF